jgi:hypothetical protein
VNERFTVAKSSGFPNAANASYEREWAVLDTWNAHKIVACFYAYRVRGTSVEQWNTLDARARRRAKLYCLALNRAERGEHFNWSDLRTDLRLNEYGPELYEIGISQ